MTKRIAGNPNALPLMEGWNGQFYDLCRSGTLHFQRCIDCGTFRYVPRELCAACGSFARRWTPSSGRGRIYSWTVVARALHPAFLKAAPVAPVVVEMKEAVRLLSQVIDCVRDGLAVGLTVEIILQAVTDDITLPFFRLARPAAGMARQPLERD